ncbi:MAG: aspartate/glutamate racemase family protein [Anaerolineales bacterium]|nr:aspartate/glutamate racemase family protein [Anaerolineales bacterium]
MKTIGLLGGMSWASSSEYYRLINEGVRARRKGFHSARCLLYSVDFAEVEAMQRDGRWEAAAEALLEGGRRLECGGADFVVLCTNTMHKLAERLEAGLAIPLLHIADPTAAAIKAQELRRVGLLGTRFTMEEAFYRGRLTHRYGLDVVVPEAEGRELVHNIIYQELVQGDIRPKSRAAVAGLIQALAAEHQLEGMILGCTELGLLIGPSDSPVPLFDTTRLHAQAAVDLALAGLEATETTAAA